MPLAPVRSNTSRIVPEPRWRRRFWGLGMLTLLGAVSVAALGVGSQGENEGAAQPLVYCSIDEPFANAPAFG